MTRLKLANLALLIAGTVMLAAGALLAQSVVIGNGVIVVTQVPTAGANQPKTEPAAVQSDDPQPTGGPHIPGPTINADVTEWVIFVSDPYSSDMNRKELSKDTLPSFIDELRDSPADTDKSDIPPIGVIRIVPDGSVEKDATIDVSLTYKGGRALGSWPVARVRSSGILWQDLQLADKPAAPQPAMPEGAWIAPLRVGQLIQSDKAAEPFLLYDLEVTYPVSLQLAVGDSDTHYSVVQPMDAPLYDLTFYKRDANGHWQTASIATLAKTPGSVMRAPEKPATPVAPPGVRVMRAAIMPPPAATQAATTGPATQPAGTVVTLVPMTEGDDTVLAPWRAKLADAGVTASDQDVALKILGHYALDKTRLTAIYRMDPAELDKVLALEVVPQPKKISRIALVVVTQIDPAIENEMDVLIAKLGAPSWKDREAAMKEIIKLGPVARTRLEKATKDKDMEIVYRAEQLLDQLTNPSNP
jgi:hypothetical protein